MSGPQATALDRDVVLLSVPADGAYLGVLRTAAAGLAARLHFTLDEVEDLRIAVDEACAMLLGLAASGAPLECRFALADGTLGVEVAVAADPAATAPARSSFAWRALTALTAEARAEVAHGNATITLTARRSHPGNRAP